ncbi:MAG: NADH-quinone oxidoreductase subunit NuoE [Rhodospirillaceae bacterium]|nr:NADH-quinone oxidoreductase subunit NuoE [Rhodospirillaceae bacterium]
MSARELAKDQPASFAFNAEYLERAKKVIAKYPAGRQASAVIPLLDFAQRQEGWVTRPAIEAIAKMLDMAAIRVLEVATFYTMFNLAPVGKTHIQVCTSLSCAVRGAGDVLKTCKDKLGIDAGDVTADKAFSLIEVECSGACVNAPVVQIGDDYYEDVDPASMAKLIDAFKRGETPKYGSMIGRDGSAPAGEPITLTEDPTKPIPKQDLAAAKAAFEKAKAEAAAKAAAPKA